MDFVRRTIKNTNNLSTNACERNKSVPALLNSAGVEFLSYFQLIMLLSCVRSREKCAQVCKTRTFIVALLKEEKIAFYEWKFKGLLWKHWGARETRNYGGDLPRLCTNETEGSRIDARKRSEIVKRRFPFKLSARGVRALGRGRKTKHDVIISHSERSGY